MPEIKNVQVSIYIEESLKLKLEEIAEKERRALSSQIAWILENYLQNVTEE